VTAGRRAQEGRAAFTHVVFDLDGTLVDSAADLVAATNHVLQSFALPDVDGATLRTYVGDGARMLVARALGPAHAGRVDEGVGRFLAYYRHHLLDTTRPYPGIGALLADLHARAIRLSVVTNKAEALSRPILEGLGLMRWIDALVGGDSLPTRKPDPAGLSSVLARTGTRRDEALMVGDSPIDRDAARAAGVAFCGVAWGFASRALAEDFPSTPVVADVAALRVLVQGGVAGAGMRRA
jgi:phosphoglycolate phosphatase